MDVRFASATPSLKYTPEWWSRKTTFFYYPLIKKYYQPTMDQRYRINALFLAGNTQSAIASILGVHSSTICRGFKRNDPM